MATSRSGVVLLVLSLGVSAPWTQTLVQVPRVQSGIVVRGRAPRVLPSRIPGRVVDVTRDSLAQMPDFGTPVTIALTASTTVDFSARSNHIEGALIGGVMGHRRWTPVELPPDVALGRASGAPALRLSIRF